MDVPKSPSLWNALWNGDNNCVPVDMAFFFLFKHKLQGLNSGPYTCMQNTSLTEVSSAKFPFDVVN